MNEQGTAVKVFANGKEVGSMGSVSTGKIGAVPETRPLTVFLTDATDTLDIDVQISNFDYRKGGMWNGVGNSSPWDVDEMPRNTSLGSGGFGPTFSIGPRDGLFVVFAARGASISRGTQSRLSFLSGAFDCSFLRYDERRRAVGHDREL